MFIHKNKNSTHKNKTVDCWIGDLAKQAQCSLEKQKSPKQKQKRLLPFGQGRYKYIQYETGRDIVHADISAPPSVVTGPFCVQPAT
jgi:hypothetical protein